VQDVILHSGLENIVVAICFAGILLVGMFRLDEIIAAPKRAKAVKRSVTGRDKNGQPVFSDPDGRPWDPSGKSGSRISRKFINFLK
jgi:hypothetical protein